MCPSLTSCSVHSITTKNINSSRNPSLSFPLEMIVSSFGRSIWILSPSLTAPASVFNMSVPNVRSMASMDCVPIWWLETHVSETHTCFPLFGLKPSSVYASCGEKSRSNKTENSNSLSSVITIISSILVILSFQPQSRCLHNQSFHRLRLSREPLLWRHRGQAIQSS